MRSIYIRDDIETILAQYARCIPEVLSTYDLSKVDVVFTGVDGIFDLVVIEDEDNEVVIGEIILSEDLEASFDIFEDNETVLDEF